MPTIVALAFAAFFAGTVDAIAGGGGLITLPALLAAGLPPQIAIGTNKGSSVWGSGSATVAFWRAGRIDRKQALFAFPLGFCGSLLGANLVLGISKDAMRPVVIAMLIVAAVVLVVRKPTRDSDDDTPRHRHLAAILALVIGAYDGFFGPGTGTFLIVGFVSLCGRSMLNASADAKVVNFASNLAAVAIFAWRGIIVWQVALPMAVGQLVGGVVGTRLAIKGGGPIVRVMVLTVSGALIAKLIYDLVT
ncbi:MAG TPA: TSUP family transporter [Kofleriaceae bacterium]|nr:TSUP family transporter [Kofleriaceae bacterium]